MKKFLKKIGIVVKLYNWIKQKNYLWPVERRELMNVLTSADVSKIKIFEAGDVYVRLNNVANLIEGGGVFLKHSACYLCEIADAVCFENSDIIQVGEKVILNKIYNIQKNYEILLDSRFVKKEDDKILMRSHSGGVDAKKISAAFSMLGVHNAHWGHFIIEFIPRLKILKENFKRESVVVLLSANLDQHMRQIVAESVGSDFEVLYLEAGESVQLEKLYHCVDCSYAANHADYIHMSSIIIPMWSRNAIHEIFNKIAEKYVKKIDQNKLKLFITRRGARVCKNFKEVEEFFVENDFLVIEPHLLTFEEKINMFNNATHVAGFFGSGMANIVFTENSLKVLALGNYERCLEAFIPQLAKTNQEIYYMIGDAYGARGIHSNYSISINELSGYINEINFLK